VSFRTRHAGLKTLVAGTLLASIHTAHGMVVVKRDFPELVARAEQIVVGTVTDIRSGDDDAGAPMTFVTFSDLTVLKGEADATLTLRFSGGTTGKYTMRVSDMPAFTAGERDVLFVAGNNRDVCPLVGVWQGRFRVRFDSASTTEVVDDNNGTPITHLVGRELIRAPQAVGTSGPAPMTLDAFRQLIANELARPHAGAGPGNDE
jgi:hypothetical protein